MQITIHDNLRSLTFLLEGTVLSRGITVAMQPLTLGIRRGGTPMFRKAFSFAGLLLLAGAAVLVTPGSGQAQHRGGGGFHGGGFHGGGFHGGFRGGGFHRGGFHRGDFHRGDFHRNFFAPRFNRGFFDPRFGGF